MRIKRCSALVLAASMGLVPVTGCENLPGGEKEQGAVIGGVGGALAGAAVGGEDNRLIGALVGGALGAGGGYLIGANMEEKKDKDKDEVREEATAAADKALNDPATAEEARKADSADINKDGFVTLDEVAAMEAANLSDREMIRRLERSEHSFELTYAQQQYLRDRGVSDEVIDAMREMKPDEARIASDRDEARQEEIEMRTDPGRK